MVIILFLLDIMYYIIPFVLVLYYIHFFNLVYLDFNLVNEVIILIILSYHSVSIMVIFNFFQMVITMINKTVIILFLLSVIFPFFHIAIIRKNYTEIILFVLIIMYKIIYLTANLYVLETFNKPLNKYFSFTIINTV